MYKAKLGSGGRFQSLVTAISKKNPKINAEAIAASIGRKKYGSKKFAQLGRKSK